jgi:cytochrome c-type biogenesis protein CcmH/NrfG
MSEVIASKLQEWRQKSADGTITLEEMREAIAAIRKERVNAQEKSTTSRTRKAKADASSGGTTSSKSAPIDSDSLLGELGL